jgi:SAM-dependent methyltransferase
VQSYPDYVARFYDVIYDSVRTADRAYYRKKILESAGPVLEVGVGTGRFFLEALQAGADIYGIDANETMLGVLRNQLPAGQRRRVSVQSAEDFVLDQRFNLVIAPFRMFSHLITVEQQLRSLQQIHDHMVDGGVFIFDLFVPNLQMLLKGLKDHVDFDGEYAPGKRLRRTTSAHADLINQINRVTMRYEWDEDDTMQAHEWQFNMRYFFHWEIEHLIARSPLMLQDVYGDYEENPLSNDSNDFVVMCRKP